MKHVFASVVAVFSVLLPSTANANVVEFETQWVIGEPLAEIASENQPAPEQNKVTIERFSSFLESRLLPPTAAIATSEIVDGKGKLLANEGAELFGLIASQGSAFCANASPGKRRSGNKYNCFFDLDNDGIFDGYVRESSTFFGSPIFTGTVRSKLREISAAGYRVVDPASTATDFTVSIYHASGSKLLGSIDFNIQFGSKSSDRFDYLTRPITVKTSSLPQIVTVMGGVFQVIEGDKKSAEIVVLKHFDRVPFEIERRRY